MNVVDTTDPTVVAQDITVALDANGNAVITAADIDGGSSDNCDVTLSMSVSPDYTADEIANNLCIRVYENKRAGNHANNSNFNVGTAPAGQGGAQIAVSYTHLRAHETDS